MKKYINKITLIIGCLFIMSCNDYLDVKKDDVLLENDLFSNKKGFEIALNGIYISMADASLYGGNLTMSFVEVLGQRFYIGRDSFGYDHNYVYLVDYDYTRDEVLKPIDKIWHNMYSAIININNFLKRLKDDGGILSDKHKEILKGEAYGLRAMLHFDLLRLFGPVYVKNPDALSIPYRDGVTPNDKERLSASEVIKKILSDLGTAENLLKDDPIIKYGKISSLLEDQDGLKQDDPALNYNDSDFYRFRNLRMNYYAVKALQARVNLYAGNKQEALKAAKIVIDIDEGGKWFPWTNKNAITSSGKPDRLFYEELIFSLPNPNITDRYRELYAPDLDDKSILRAEPTRLEKDVYESNKNDYRFKSNWKNLSGKSYKTFVKFRQDDISIENRLQQPLIRLSEMYYIAAETETNPGKALEYLNTVRAHRGLDKKINSINNLKKEIRQEYKKEFYGEGQLFFYYKRLNYNRIPRATPYYGYLIDINMNDKKYILPIPLSEDL